MLSGNDGRVVEMDDREGHPPGSDREACAEPTAIERTTTILRNRSIDLRESVLAQQCGALRIVQSVRTSDRMRLSEAVTNVGCNVSNMFVMRVEADLLECEDIRVDAGNLLARGIEPSGNSTSDDQRLQVAIRTWAMDLPVM